MRPSDRLNASRERVLALVESHGARHVRVFGSAARRSDHDDSDVDLLVEWPPGRSLLQLVSLQQALEAELGAKVDLCTERELHPLLRDRILAEARTL